MNSRFPGIMNVITVVTALTTAALAVTYHLVPHDWLLSAAITTGTTFYHFAMRLVVGSIVPSCIQKPMAHRWFAQKRLAPRMYAFLRVKQWKDHMPTYAPASFSLRHNSLERIVYNSCVSEAVHTVIVLFSFVPILFSLWWDALPVFLITSILAALFDSCFIIMQRYNRPRLVRILRKKEASDL